MILKNISLGFQVRMILTLILTMCLSGTNSLLYCQSKKAELEKKRSSLEKNIKYTEQLLNETRKNKEATINQVVILDSRISKREQLIDVIGEDIERIRIEILQKEQRISQLSSELGELRDQYGKMINRAFRSRNSYSKLTFVIASENFNQAIRRLKYLQQITQHRKQQIEKIENTRKEIGKMVNSLKQDEEKKLKLLGIKSNEIDQLKLEKDQKSVLMANLSDQEKKLRRQLDEDKKAAQKLREAIEKIIAEEIGSSEKAAGKTSKTGSFMLTPDDARLSGNFSSNIGRLPWPAEKGMLSSSFGEHPHPTLKGIKTQNNGINILTQPGQEARSVFDGTVTRVFPVPGFNNVVIIRHGEYLTVYSNLESVAVKAGDKVKTKQIIGTIFTDPEESKTELHFELWKGKTLLNPETWLTKF